MRYRIQEGAAAWMLHRLTGVGIVLFLLPHILDITLIGWGPKPFNALLVFYRALPFRILEICLAAAVTYHALNGVRIMLVDFWPRGPERQRAMFYIILALFALLFIPTAAVMLTAQ